jgi:hypothetical protein
MNRREVVTFPGPGGSSISCCILPAAASSSYSLACWRD